MSNARHQWTLDLTLIAPFASTGVENVSHGIDKAFLRNEQGRIVLSGQQLRGLFRHFLMDVIKAEDDAGIDEKDRLVKMDWFFNWFGRPGLQYGSEQGDLRVYEALGKAPPDKAGKGGLGRGRLTIRDLELKEGAEEEGNEATNRTRIRVDGMRKSVKAGALLVREQLHKTGEKVDFSSAEGVILYGGESERQSFEKAFNLFMENLPEIGAMKSAGYGQVADYNLASHAIIPLRISGESGLEGSSWSILMNFSHPLLVEPRLASGNVQESAEYVSGAVLKAAIAEYGHLADRNFDKNFAAVLSSMIIRFARPVSEGGNERPRTMPFSLVRTGTGIADFFTTGDDEEIRFETNFKQPEHEAVRREYGQQDIAWISQTRTAIELGKQHAADSQLFNYRMAGVWKTTWIAQIVLPIGMTDTDKKKALSLINFLESGVVQIGKTRSDLKARIQDRNEDKIETEPDGFWRITLQSPACLFDLECIKKLRTGTVTLRDAYIDYFKRTLDNTADIVNWSEFDFLARHRLSGGHRATFTRRQRNEPYYPFLLTEAGSVFRFPLKEGKDGADVETVMNKLATDGLPSIDNDWGTNPFVPQNGYGEIRIDGEDAIMAGNVRLQDA